jgi:hypothetical protein
MHDRSISLFNLLEVLVTNTAWVHARLCKLQKGCTRLATASDKAYQLLAHGRWFSPASSTTKTGPVNFFKYFEYCSREIKLVINIAIRIE